MNPTCPIAVYQMGKVGSETILHSLKALKLDNPIYHIHVLCTENLKRSTHHLKSQNLPLTLQLKHGQTLQAYLNESETPELKVITAVREPISQFVSAIFQNIEAHFPHLIDVDGNWKEEEITQYLYNRLINYNLKAPSQNCNWFDAEFQPALNIDIYEYDFKPQLGYLMLNQNQLDVLVLKLEMSQIWGEVLGKFLDRASPIKLVQRNFADNKKYKQAYKQVISQLRLPSSVLKTIYSSKYCQYFYTPEEIDRFIERWSA